MSAPLAQSDTAKAPLKREKSAGRTRRRLHNLFIALLLFLLLEDGLPTTHDGHQRVKDFLDPVVDTLGLWQGNWRLFAPDPDHMNTWVEAKVTYSDNTEWAWKTPNWRERSYYEKFIQGRHPKFWDAFRLDKRKGIWPFVADYAARIAPTPASGARPIKVELLRHWWDVPPPNKIAEVVKEFGESPPPRDKFPNTHSFYTKVIR